MSADLRAGSAAIAREQEYELVRRWRDHSDIAARDVLIRAQLRHVLAVARKYRRYGHASLEDLVAEGSLGLLRALEKFDPERGTRLVTYAIYWIRAYIAEYVIRSRSVVAAGAQVKRPGSCDIPWERDEAPNGSFAETFASPSLSAEETLMSAQSGDHLVSSVARVVSRLDARERYIVRARLMAHRDDELSLAEIGRHFGISRERARQLEARAMRKVKRGLARSSLTLSF